MSSNWRRALWRLGIFLGVCLLGVFALYAVFGQMRFGEKAKDYNAEFTQRDRPGRPATSSASPVWRSARSRRSPSSDDTTVLVEFTADDSVVLTEGNRAVIRYDNLIGGRYLALVEGAGGTKRLNPG